MAVNSILAFAVIASVFYLRSILRAKFGGQVKAPVVGSRSPWEPYLLTRLRFTKNALHAINEGYTKFKDSRFKMLRNDTDVLVLSNKYIDELRSLPESTLSPLQAHVDALLGKYTKVDILLGSNLHTRMLQSRLTPNLTSFLPIVRNELLFGMKADFPACKGKESFLIMIAVTNGLSFWTEAWVAVNVTNVMLRLVARISARIFVGPLCRNEEWLTVSVNYSLDIFRTVLFMRLFPPFLHPILSLVIPDAWQVRRDMRLARRLITPLVEERTKAQSLGDASYEKPNDLLQWMMDGANESESKPDKLAHRQLLLTLASIHTTTMSVTHALYDLAAMPEYIQPLRAEIEQILKEDGDWQKNGLTKMRKLDSFLKESQRMNPPSLIAFNRVVQKPITLSDGTYLPKGTHFGMASVPLVFDEDLVDKPHTFDGFRYYRKRLETGESHRHQFATTDANSLHFGHGKYACPGRFLASNEIKTLLAHVLMEYDLKFLPGQSRPPNQSVNEYIFPDPAGQLLFKERVTEAPSS
ncbi:MAG: hypothetical protein M1830_004991 [Pleopsidium flavum]|nr:MAG: hypothetical protein M1830_004991 [Pleopsidium flavum]